MLLVIKIVLVAFGLFSQAEITPTAETPIESELDTLALPNDHPEWVLARRAMASEGLCRSGHEAEKDTVVATLPADLPEASVYDHSIVRLVAEACE
jgi:hypothetical protein